MCLSIADVPLGQTKPLQHRSHWCNALWDEPTSSFLSSSTSLTHLSHSHNSTFCLATAIPQMWSGLQRTITAQHQVAMTTTLYLICILCLHYLLMPNMVTLLFYPPLSASPFYNFLFPSIFTTVNTRFVSNVYVRTQTCTHACSL